MPTKDMKTVQQKSDLITRLKGIRKLISDYREKRKDELFRYTVLIIISLISALAIQGKAGIDHLVGNFLIITFIFFIFFKDIKRYKPAYLNNNKMMLLLGILIAGTVILGRIFAHMLLALHKGFDLPPEASFIFGIPLPVGAMLITLIFDFHLAISFSFAMSLLTGMWLNDPYYSIYIFIGSLTAAFGVFRCKRRSALIKGGLYVGAVNVASAAIILLVKGNLFAPLAPSTLLFAGLSGLSVAAVISIVLPAIEYIFGIVTDISLVELLDLDQPLMRALMINAPGTYHHSVIVGNLAESAAEAVGANALLARVCSYYHDIGKLKMPDYFIENQRGSISRHDKLAPTMSSMILTSHIKEGIELGRHYKLPQSIIDIIEQHHGTSLITYFYHKAVELKTDGSPPEETYRYPGPKPQSRVAALVMMADAVEAASRTLTDPTPSRITALVEKIINSIFLAGQIDECELTLRDMSEIKRRFTYILTSIFHRRIEYPDFSVKGIHGRDEKIATAKGNGSNSKEQPTTDKDKPPEDHARTTTGTETIS